MSEEKKRPNQKTRVGVVVSNKMDKTAIVRVDRRMSHPEFEKIVTRSKRYYAHDEENVLGIGDRVRIVETRPLSKLKRWRVKDIIEKGEG